MRKTEIQRPDAKHDIPISHADYTVPDPDGYGSVRMFDGRTSIPRDCRCLARDPCRGGCCCCSIRCGRKFRGQLNAATAPDVCGLELNDLPWRGTFAELSRHAEHTQSKKLEDMEPLVFMEEIVPDPRWRSLPTVDLGSGGHLENIGDDVVVFLKLRPSLLEWRFFEREYRVGVLTPKTAEKVRSRLEKGSRYRLRVSDLPCAVNGLGARLRISIWMELS